MFDPVIFLPLLLAMVSTASANVTTKLVPVVETIPDPTPSVGEFWIDEDKSIPLRLTTVTHIDASQSTTVVPVIISSPKVDEIVHQSVAVFTVPGQVAPSPSSSDHNGTHHIPVVEEEHSGNSQHAGPTTVYQTVYLPSPSSTSTWSTAYEDSVTIVLTVYVNNAAATASTSTSSSSTTTSEYITVVIPKQSSATPNVVVVESQKSSQLEPTTTQFITTITTQSAKPNVVVMDIPNKASTEVITITESSDPKVVVVQPKPSTEVITVTEHGKPNVVVVQPKESNEVVTATDSSKSKVVVVQGQSKESSRFITIVKTLPSGVTETDIIVVKPKDPATATATSTEQPVQQEAKATTNTVPSTTPPPITPTVGEVTNLITQTKTQKVTKTHFSTSYLAHGAPPPPAPEPAPEPSPPEPAVVTVVEVVTVSNAHPFGIGASHTPAAYYTHQPDADPGGIHWAQGVHTVPGDRSAEFERLKPPVWPTWEVNVVVAPWKQTESETGAGAAAAAAKTGMHMGMDMEAARSTTSVTTPDQGAGAGAVDNAQAQATSTVEVEVEVEVTSTSASAVETTSASASTIHTTLTSPIVHTTSTSTSTPVIEIISITNVVANSDATTQDTHETPTTEHEHEGDDTTTSEADGTQEPQEQESPDIVHVHVQARDSNMDNIDNNINLVAQGCRDRNPKGWITLSGTRSNPNPTYGPPLTWPQHCDGGITFITAIRKMPSFITSTSIDNAAATPMITAAPAPSSHPELEPTDSSDSEKHESLDAGGDIMTAHVTRTPAQTSYSTRTLTCGNRIRDNDRGTVVNMKHKRIEDNINAEEHNAISIIAEHNITEVQQALVSLAVQDGGKDGDFWSEIGDGIKEGVERFGNDVVEGLNNPICFLIPCHHAKFGDHAHRDHHG
ncbi:hypothetical protein B0T09DRAFT_290620 [Sordaria sp. MPI-SDFR-AT-0083]|nr:hypothetical protein B0T09DRAFT_290620 [Sordaria sp. MPI-SDFR-AT-0083]